MLNRICGFAIAGVMLTAGCGGSPSEPDPDCLELDPAMLERIAEGLTDPALTLESGVAVELPEAEQAFGYRYAVAVAVDGETPILATASIDDGPILAADNLARVFFTWGEAATDDSAIGEWRDSMFLGESAESAARCLD